MLQREPWIEKIEEKLLVGKRVSMSLSVNKTLELWRSFMPYRKGLTAPKNNYLYSVQLYPTNYFDAFNPDALFEKWSATEVSSVENLPDGMAPLIITAGLYAVFPYKGSNTDTSIFTYIFTEWLPRSSYQLDNRPHFELLGEKYKNGDPESEEDIFIPIKQN